MKVRTMIEAAVATQPGDVRRLRAAMELGARFALEAVLSDSSYTTTEDVKRVLAELDGMPSVVLDEPVGV